MPVKIQGSSFTHSPYCSFPHPTPRQHYSIEFYKKVATHSVDIIGYATYLCRDCAKKWREDMETALKDVARTSPQAHAPSDE